MENVDREVLKELGGAILKPAIVEAVIAGIREALQPETQQRTARSHKVELAAVERELDRLTEAIAAGGPLASLVAKVQARQTKRDELLTAIAAAEAVGCVDLGLIERQVRAKLDDWRSLLTRNVADGRKLFREVLEGPIRFAPVDGGFRFEGRADAGRLLAGTAFNQSGVPTGIRRSVELGLDRSNSSMSERSVQNPPARREPRVDFFDDAGFSRSVSRRS